VGPNIDLIKKQVYIHISTSRSSRNINTVSFTEHRAC